MPFLSLCNANSILRKDSSVPMNVLEQMGFVQLEHELSLPSALFLLFRWVFLLKKNPVLTELKISSLHWAHVLQVTA